MAAVGLAGVPQSPDCWSSCNIQRKMREGALDDDKGMVIDVEGVQRGECAWVGERC